MGHVHVLIKLEGLTLSSVHCLNDLKQFCRTHGQGESATPPLLNFRRTATIIWNKEVQFSGLKYVVKNSGCTFPVGLCGSFLVGEGGETDNVELRELGEKIVTPSDSHLRRNKINLQR